MKVIARLIVSATLALAGAAHACDRQCTAAWFNSDPKTRISETGPILSAYGEEGNASMEAVSRCKMDVAVVMQGKPAYQQFIKQCYRLYPARVRDQMYHVDYRYVPTDRVDVYIHIDNKSPAERGFLCVRASRVRCHADDIRPIGIQDRPLTISHSDACSTGADKL